MYCACGRLKASTWPFPTGGVVQIMSLDSTYSSEKGRLIHLRPGPPPMALDRTGSTDDGRRSRIIREFAVPTFRKFPEKARR